MTITSSQNLFNLTRLFLNRCLVTFCIVYIYAGCGCVSCCQSVSRSVLHPARSLSANGTSTWTSAPPSPGPAAVFHPASTEDMTPLWLTWFLPRLLGHWRFEGATIPPLEKCQPSAQNTSTPESRTGLETSPEPSSTRPGSSSPRPCSSFWTPRRH